MIKINWGPVCIIQTFLTTWGFFTHSPSTRSLMAEAPGRVPSELHKSESEVAVIPRDLVKTEYFDFNLY